MDLPISPASKCAAAAGSHFNRVCRKGKDRQMLRRRVWVKAECRHKGNDRQMLRRKGKECKVECLRRGKDRRALRRKAWDKVECRLKGKDRQMLPHKAWDKAQCRLKGKDRRALRRRAWGKAQAQCLLKGNDRQMLPHKAWGKAQCLPNQCSPKDHPSPKAITLSALRAVRFRTTSSPFYSKFHFWQHL